MTAKKKQEEPKVEETAPEEPKYVPGDTSSIPLGWTVQQEDW